MMETRSVHLEITNQYAEVPSKCLLWSGRALLRRWRKRTSRVGARIAPALLRIRVRPIGTDVRILERALQHQNIYIAVYIEMLQLRRSSAAN